MAVNQGGFVNSLDSLTSFLIAIMLTIAIFIHLANFSLSAANEQKQLSLYLKGLALADSLVKIPLNDCCEIGFADFDDSLHRAIQNKISLNSIQPKLQQLNELPHLRKLVMQFKSSPEIILIAKPFSDNCISFERFVFADTGVPAQKVKLTVVVCDE